MAAGLIRQFQGGSYDLKKLGGLYKARPLLAFLFLIPALSLAGIPPTSGFFGKLFLIYAGFDAQDWTITIVALLVSIITLFSMIKIWNEAAWKPALQTSDMEKVNGKVNPFAFSASLAITVLTLSLGLTVVWTFDYFIEAARQLLDNQSYIDAVLNPVYNISN